MNCRHLNKYNFELHGKYAYTGHSDTEEVTI
jgi:hypothetical protein